jgi:hypothetical protein
MWVLRWRTCGKLYSYVIKREKGWVIFQFQVLMEVVGIIAEKTNKPERRELYEIFGPPSSNYLI